MHVSTCSYYAFFKTAKLTGWIQLFKIFIFSANQLNHTTYIYKVLGYQNALHVSSSMSINFVEADLTQP